MPRRVSIVHRIVVGSVIAAIVAGLTPLTASAAAAPAAWRDPVAISQPGLSAEYLVADGNADGSAVAAWIARTDENVRSLEVSRRELGGPWGAPERVAEISETSSARVVVAMHRDGTVALAWFLWVQWGLGRRAALAGETGDLDPISRGARVVVAD